MEASLAPMVVLSPDPGDLLDPVLAPDPLPDGWLDWCADQAPDFFVPIDSVAWDADGEGAEVDGWPPTDLLSDLDDVPPGPLLASLLAATDLAGCSDSDLAGAVRAAYRLQSWAAALEVEATNVLVDRCASWRGVAPAGEQVAGESVSAELMAAVEIGCALDLAPQTARAKVMLARDLARLPATRLGLAAGTIDLAKARLLVDELRPLDRRAGRAAGGPDRARRRGPDPGAAAGPAAAGGARGRPRRGARPGRRRPRPTAGRGVPAQRRDGRADLHRHRAEGARPVPVADRPRARRARPGRDRRPYDRPGPG